MRLRRIPGNAAAAFILLALVGCSGSSADGEETGDGDHAESAEGSDAAPPDAGDAGTDGSSADAEPPPAAPPHCGDGVLDPDEECDDGNRLDGDDCDWLCRLGPGEPVDDTPDPSVGDLELDLSWISVVPSLPAAEVSYTRSLALLWTGSAYATVWNAHWRDPDGVRWDDAQFRLFDRLGRPGVPDWTYHYPDRVFTSLDLAWSGRFFGLVWRTENGEDPERMLSAMILDAVGKPLVGPFTLIEDPGCGDATVTWDGEAFAAVWVLEHGESPGIGIARFDELGSIVVVLPSVYERPPDMGLTAWSASSPAATVTAFIEQPLGGTGSDGRRLRWLVTGSGGRPLRPPAELGPNDVGPAAIAWGERHFAIVFGAGTSPYDTRGFHLALLDADGFLVGPPRRVLDHSNYGDVALAWGAGGWAIAYEDWDHAVHLLRTDAAGTLISAEATADPGTPLSGAVAMAFDGEGFGILTNRSPDVLFTRYVVVP